MFAAQQRRQPGATLVVTEDAATIETYLCQAQGPGALAAVAQASTAEVEIADVVLASPAVLPAL